MPSEQSLGIRSLAGMAHALGRSQGLDRLLEIAAEESCVALHAASVSISRIEPGTATVRTLINAGDLGPHEVRWPKDQVNPVRDGIMLSSVVHELLTWTADSEEPDCDPAELELLEELEKGSSMGAPILVEGRLWGEFYATRHLGRAPFSSSDSAYVEVLVAILGAALARALREESLERLAFYDPLTGLMNRRGLDQQAALAFDVPSNVSRTVTVVVLDINGLESVNDTLGHTAGDQFIVSVARALNGAFARLPGSLVARVGGDEFTALVSGAHPARVVEVANDLCALKWPLVSGAGITAGAAAVVVTESAEVVPRDLFAAADRAQQVAKRARMLRVVVSDLYGHGLTDGPVKHGHPLRAAGQSEAAVHVG